MAKATGKSGYGSGWHKQSGRHSNAAKYGRAGGTYLSHITRLSGKTYYDSNKDLIYVKGDDGFAILKKNSVDDQLIRFQFREFLKHLKDTDGDGVPDKYDCDPKNKYKQDQMKTFDIGDGYQIVAEWKKTRNGFKHEAVLMHNGEEIDRAKINYLNRTWESYEYQSVVDKLINKNFANENERNRMKAYASGKAKEDVERKFGAIANLAALGEVMGSNRKQKIEFRKKALSKLEGISFPDDFDTLPEAEQERRLDAATEQLRQKE